MLGRALPLLNNPLTVAEEYAILDNLTRGRLIAGFVRGIGAEYHAMGINPAYSQERFARRTTHHPRLDRAGAVPAIRQALPVQIREPVAAALPEAASADLDSLARLEHDDQWAAQIRYTYCQTLARSPSVARFFQMYRDEADKAGYRPRPTSWPGRTHLRRRDRREGDARGASRISRRWSTRLLKMPTEMLLPPGYTDAASMKRIRAAKIAGKPQTIEDFVEAGVVMVGRPEHRAREARGISGPRRLQHIADQDPVRHAAATTWRAPTCRRSQRNTAAHSAIACRKTPASSGGVNC